MHPFEASPGFSRLSPWIRKPLRPNIVLPGYGVTLGCMDRNGDAEKAYLLFCIYPLVKALYFLGFHTEDRFYNRLHLHT